MRRDVSDSCFCCAHSLLFTYIPKSVHILEGHRIQVYFADILPDSCDLTLLGGSAIHDLIVICLSRGLETQPVLHGLRHGLMVHALKWAGCQVTPTA